MSRKKKMSESLDDNVKKQFQERLTSCLKMMETIIIPTSQTEAFMQCQWTIFAEVVLDGLKDKKAVEISPASSTLTHLETIAKKNIVALEDILAELRRAEEIISKCPFVLDVWASEQLKMTTRWSKDMGVMRKIHTDILETLQGFQKKSSHE